MPRLATLFSLELDAIGEREAEMGWLNLFTPPEAGATDIRIFNGNPQDGSNQSVGVPSAIPDASEPPLSEEIKRSQVALIIRYVTAIRGR